jgi:MtN3 and saliva related transmembrane protein
MSKELVEIMGLIGAFLSSITFMPQVYKTWKMKSAGDLSLSMMLIVFTSTIIWLVYGFSLHLIPVIICNGIIMLLSALLIYFKLTFKNKIICQSFSNKSFLFLLKHSQYPFYRSISLIFGISFLQ